MISGILGLTWNVEEPLTIIVFVLVNWGVRVCEAAVLVENSVTLTFVMLVAVVLLMSMLALCYGRAAFVDWVEVKQCIWAMGRLSVLSSRCTLVFIRLAVLMMVMARSTVCLWYI